MFRIILSGMLCLLCLSLYAFPQQGLVAHWTFDSVAGNNYYDVTGHSYHAVATGSGLTLAPGVKGDALSFPDSGYEVTVPNSKNNFRPQYLTIETWYYPKKSIPAKGQAELLDYSYSSTGFSKGYSLYINSTGNASLTSSSYDGRANLTCSTKSVLLVNKWYHIAATYDGKSFCIFLNGILEGTFNYSPGMFVLPQAELDARIGCQRFADSSVGYFANGKIDEMALYNYAMLADSIVSHSYSPLRAPALIPYDSNYTHNLRPILKWFANKAISAYKIQIASNQDFRSPIDNSATSDTFYSPSIDLPVGIIYWRVGNDADTTVWSAPSSFTEMDPSIVLVPNQYFTVTEAIQHAKGALVTANLTEDIVLEGINFSIEGINRNTITGKTKIINSIVSLKRLQFNGKTGRCGGSDGCMKQVGSCSGAPQAASGEAGDTALIVNNSTLTCDSCSVKGGSGGDGQIVWSGTLMNYTTCSKGMCGKGGVGIASQNSKVHLYQSDIYGGDGGGTCSKGTAINGSINTTIDTSNVKLGTVTLDGTSKMIAGTTFAMPTSFEESEICLLSPKMFSSGIITLLKNAYLSISIYTISGRLISFNVVNGNRFLIPSLNNGIYVIIVKTTNHIFNYKYFISK
jgi:hypothetical protein